MAEVGSAALLQFLLAAAGVSTSSTPSCLRRRDLGVEFPHPALMADDRR